MKNSWSIEPGIVSFETPRFLEVGEALPDLLPEVDLEVAPGLDADDLEEPLLREFDLEEEDLEVELLFLFAVLGITHFIFR